MLSMRNKTISRKKRQKKVIYTKQIMIHPAHWAYNVTANTIIYTYYALLFV